MIKFSQKDKKLTWQFIVARKFSPFYEHIFITATGLGYFKHILGYEHSYRRIYLDGELFYCKEDIISEKEKLLKQIKHNIKLVAKRATQAEKEGEKLIDFAYSVQKKNLIRLNNQEIKKILLNFFMAFRHFVPFLMMPITIEAYLEEKLDAYFNMKYAGNHEKISDAKSIILTQARKNLQEEEQISILKLAEEFRKERKITENLNKKIKKHLDKFSALGLRYGIGDMWQGWDIIQRIKPLSRNNPYKRYLELILRRKQVEKRFKELICELKPDKYTREIIKIIREYIYLRTYRTNILNNSLAIIKPFLEKIAKRLNVDWDALNYMVLPEVFDSLDSGIVHKKIFEEIGKRKRGFATIFINNKFHIFTGEDIDKLAQFFNLRSKISKQNIIKGVVANPGNIKGIVKILFTPDDNKKVKNGNILVTSMTTPNFVPAMEKAAAFITDEGGILCHAAIVSREMNKPCIIGTKIATKVLKDGDLVEVDANKGVVRIVNKAK